MYALFGWTERTLEFVTNQIGFIKMWTFDPHLTQTVTQTYYMTPIYAQHTALQDAFRKPSPHISEAIIKSPHISLI